ncbi:MAG: hypothetical protein AAGG48_30070 [Planctomycetota bacterium]
MTRTLALVSTLLFATLLQADTASLTLRFVFDGEPPAAKPLEVPAKFQHVTGPIPNERLVIDPESRGIRNIVVHVFTGRGGSEIELNPYDGKKRQLITENNRFEPHILFARAGDKLELIDKLSYGHSPHIAFLNNPTRSLTVAPLQNPLPLKLPEPVPIRVLCNINPWMEAHLVILDHPFAAISDSRGAIRIDGLPVDSDLVFRVLHEAAPIQQVTIEGVSQTWDRSRFRLKLSPGVNDLGDVFVSSDTFTDKSSGGPTDARETSR